MIDRVSDEMIEHVGILAKLELTEEERRQAKQDMGRMLDCIDKLKEVDTTGVEPLSHVVSVQNVFREDMVVNGDGRADALRNAPERKADMFVVPKTFQ